jgi:hypothetical protein
MAMVIENRSRFWKTRAWAYCAANGNGNGGTAELTMVTTIAIGDVEASHDTSPFPLAKK